MSVETAAHTSLNRCDRAYDGQARPDKCRQLPYAWTDRNGGQDHVDRALEGASWSEPAEDNWTVAGCDPLGSAIRVGYEDFHPDLRGIARWLPRMPISQRSLKTVRALQRVPRQRARNVEIVPMGNVTVRLHRPAVPERPVPGLLWIHGGGMVMGNAAEEDRTCRLFADELGIVVVAVDYRVAPENPFPIPLHDCYDALAWFTGQPEVDPSRLAVGGASAGGGLAASLALLARDRGDISPVFQLLVSSERCVWRATPVISMA